MRHDRLMDVSDVEVSIFLTGVQLNRRGSIVTAIPYFAFLGWYYIFAHYVLRFIIGESTEAFFICNASFNFLVSFALILGSYLIRTIETSFVYAWSILSSIGLIFILLVPTEIFKLVIYLLLGVVFGIGLLAFLTFFWDLTVPEERGRVAGSLGFVFLPICSLLIALASSLNFLTTTALCISLNLGTLAIKPLNPKKITMLARRKGLEGHNPEKRTIMLYFIPWAIFSLVNATLATTISFHVSQYFSPSSEMSLMTLQVVGGGLGAMIGGVIADFFGRRSSLVLGLTLYGVSSAISGLAKSYEMFFPAFIGSGLTWGIFLTLYLFVIWGDLSTKKTCVRRYSIGLAIFYLAAGLGALFSSELSQISLLVASVSSCLLIFLSNIPLIMAPELLPSDFSEKVRIKLYISLAKKILRSRTNTPDQSREP